MQSLLSLSLMVDVYVVKTGIMCITRKLCTIGIIGMCAFLSHHNKNH